MFKPFKLATITFATIFCLGMMFAKTPGVATTKGIEIEYRSFSSTPTIGLPADKYTADLAQSSKKILGEDQQVRLKKISPKPEVPNDDIISAVGEGGKLVNGNGFDAAYISGSSLNPAWGFIYNSGIPTSNVGFDRFLGFLYGNNTDQSGINLAQKLLDKNHKNIVAIPLVGGSAQGSGYFPKPVSDTNQEPGIGLAGLCRQPWTFRYLPPAQNVLDMACDSLVGADKKINFVKAVPGGEIINEVISNRVQAFEFVTPKDDFSFFFSDSEKPNLGDLGLKYLHYPSWHQPFLITYLIVNQQVWQMLSPKQQHLILTSAKTNVIDSYAQNITGQGEALQKILNINQNDNNSENDIRLVKWGKKDLKILKSASAKFLETIMQNKDLSVSDRQDYETVILAYQKYLDGDRDYWEKFPKLKLK